MLSPFEVKIETDEIRKKVVKTKKSLINNASKPGLICDFLKLFKDSFQLL